VHRYIFLFIALIKLSGAVGSASEDSTVDPDVHCRFRIAAVFRLMLFVSSMLVMTAIFPATMARKYTTGGGDQRSKAD
jgi:hypothetical protein